MSQNNRQYVGAFVLASLGVAGWFVLSTVAMDQVPDAVLVGVPTLVAALILGTILGRGVVSFWKGSSAQVWLEAALGGIAAFWAAPLMVLTQRATDAPSGAEVLFFSTVAWGALSALGALFAGGRTLRSTLPAALLSVAGSAALLANWERPSSFSPLSKFPEQEVWMLIAGAVFVLGGLAILRSARGIESKNVLVVAVGSAGVVGALGALLTGSGYMPTVMRMSTEFVLMGVALSAFVFGWSRLGFGLGLARAGVPFLIAPVTVTALFALERATRVFGPTPFQIPGVVAGGAVCLAGAAVVWFSRPGTATIPMRSTWLLVGEWVSAGAAVVSLGSLALPALRASSHGVMPQEFSATWLMVGAESAAGWLPVVAAFLVLSIAWDVRQGRIIRESWMAVVAALIAVGVFPLLADTTLHTWNRWLPAMVQQTYGTEYARFAVETVINPVRSLALALVVVAATMLTLAVYAGSRDAGRSEPEEMV